jgi:hypothetical protein
MVHPHRPLRAWNGELTASSGLTRRSSIMTAVISLMPLENCRTNSNNYITIYTTTHCNPFIDLKISDDLYYYYYYFERYLLSTISFLKSYVSETDRFFHTDRINKEYHSVRPLVWARHKFWPTWPNWIRFLTLSWNLNNETEHKYYWTAYKHRIRNTCVSTYAISHLLTKSNTYAFFSKVLMVFSITRVYNFLNILNYKS